MAVTGVEVRRTGWDVALGILMVLAGIVVLGDVALASKISVLFLGWMAIVIGVVLFVSAWAHRGTPTFWFGVVGGPLVAMFGVGLVKNPLVGLAAITLLAGCIYLGVGIVRVAAAFAPGGTSWPLLFSGVITLVLALLVLVGWPESALWLVGVLVGVHAIVDGLALAVVGRVRPAALTT